MTLRSDAETNSILIAELELSSIGDKSIGYFLHISHRNAASGREVGPFETRSDALGWLNDNYGGGLRPWGP